MELVDRLRDHWCNRRMGGKAKAGITDVCRILFLEAGQRKSYSQNQQEKKKGEKDGGREDHGSRDSMYMIPKNASSGQRRGVGSI